jgi:HK97 gp10 family phage protein
MKVEVKLSGLDGVLDTLKKLPPDVVSKRGGPVKAALRKGALVIFKAAQANLYRATADIGTGDDKGTGLLLKNLVVTRGKEPTGTKGERYLVRVRRKAYTDRKGKTVTTLVSANLLEYGSSKQPAEPWLRPAFNAKAGEAIKTIETELLKGVDRIVKKLSKGR